MGLFDPRCPVTPEEHDWITANMQWFQTEFGDEPLRRPVVLPNDDFFPGVYRGAEEDVIATFQRIALAMRIDLRPVRFELVADDEAALRANLPVNSRYSGAAGHFQVVDGSPIVTVHMGEAKRPVSLVATIAHELAHVLLLFGERIDRDRPDMEPLTDLLTVYFGLGIFGANASFEYERGAWQRLGYLTEPMFGYALADYALRRGEADPPWIKYVDTNPRSALRKGIKYLRHLAPGQAQPDE